MNLHNLLGCLLFIGVLVFIVFAFSQGLKTKSERRDDGEPPYTGSGG